MDEINALHVEMTRVAGKLHNHHSSLPENSLNKGRGQTLDMLRVENVLIPSYLLQESRDRSKLHANPSYMLPCTPGHCKTTSSTPLPAVDASKCIHSMLDGFHKPTHRNSMCPYLPTIRGRVETCRQYVRRLGNCMGNLGVFQRNPYPYP